jgi:plasmid maintenance system antidote protein VapI
MQRPNASRLLNGKAGIGIRTALALERLGHGSAREWLIRQVDYELEEHQP